MISPPFISFYFTLKNNSTKFLFYLSILFFTLNTFSQKETNFWYFGRKAGVNFNTSPPTAITDGELETFEGCSSFSDVNGNLLFYVGAPNTEANSLTVWDKNHKIMKYTNGYPGNNLIGHTSSSQSAMIVPKPASTSIYYVFTVGDQHNPNFNLYTIDMSLNNGNGQIINENGVGSFHENLSSNTLDASLWTEKVAAVRGSECNSFWVVTLAGNHFYSYKITTSGVNSVPVISKVNNYTAKKTRGCLKLSPDGKKLVVAHENSPLTSKAFIYSFNASTGKVSDDGISLFNENNIFDGRAYGVEFSIDSKKLYISSSSKFRNNLLDLEKSVYRIFQYEVNSTDILKSKKIIYENKNGFRGALQLGPDRKIYTLVPEVYNDKNTDPTYLSVIENPTADAKDVIFTKKSIHLKGRVGTQGLPPFIASLLRPIKITDSDTDEIINNTDLKFCKGQNKILVPETVTGNNITYEWFFNNGIEKKIISTSANLILNDLDNSNKGIYNLIVKLTDNCGNNIEYEGVFNIDVIEAAIATKPMDIDFCDSDNDGFHIFDFQTNKNLEILNGLNATTFEVLYFDSIDNANENTLGTALTNPYQNPSAFSSQTIYARVHNKKAPNTCYDITSFQLNIYRPALPTQPTNYRICDDIASGSDIDKTSIFKLKNKDSEILGDLDPNEFNISYHTSSIDAQTSSKTNPINKNLGYSVTDQQIVYVRVENKNNIACNIVSTNSENIFFKPFFLIVDSYPVIKQNTVVLKKCDDNNDLVATFNLTEVEETISDNHQNETFEYYIAEEKTGSKTQQITDKLNYSVNNSGEVWVKVISEFGCHRFFKIELLVSFASDINYNKEFAVCDDFLDKNGNDTQHNSDTDGISSFDLSQAKQDILNHFPTSIQDNLEISFYESELDRSTATNQIVNITNHRNNKLPSFANNQTIYVNIKNKINDECTGYSQFFLKVNSYPVIKQNTVVLKKCDDNNDLVATFNLTEVEETISDNHQNETFEYYIAEEKIGSKTQQITDKLNYSVNNSGEVWVKVISEFGCHRFFKIELLVSFASDINYNKEFAVCDDFLDKNGNDTQHNSDTDGISSFDLSQAKQDILNHFPTSIQDNLEISFYESELDRSTATNQIVNITNHRNNKLPSFANNQTIYVNIKNKINDECTGYSQFFLKVNSYPVIKQNTVVLKKCDDNNDLVATFNLTEVEETISDNHQNETFEYYIAEEKTGSKTQQITDKLNYSVNNSGEVWVKVISEFGCHRFFKIELLVSFASDINYNKEFAVCDDFLDRNGNDTQHNSDTDGISSFDLSQAKQDILNHFPTSIQDNLEISFYESELDRSTATNQIVNITNHRNNKLPSFANNQTIYVNIKNKINDECTGYSQFFLKVNSYPVIKQNTVVLKKCDDNNDLVATFNLTEVEETISDNHQNETFEYYITEEKTGSKTQQITDKLNYSVHNSGEVWVKVISEFGCHRFFKIELLVSFASDINYNKEFAVCDDFLDKNGNDTQHNSDTDGISSFDLSQAKQDILNHFPTSIQDNLEISFYESELDRSTATNQIVNITNHRNNKLPSFANNQTIYVNIKNKINDECTGYSQFFLKVNSYPNFNVTGEENIDTPQFICLNDLPLILEAENPDEIYYYEWTNENGIILGTERLLEVTKGGKYTVTASFSTNSSKECSRTKTIIVKESEAPTLLESYITINDGLKYNTNNHYISIDTFYNNLGAGEYQFALLNENDNTRIPDLGFQDEPYFGNLEGGVYTIIVNDKNGCNPNKKLTISVIEFPKFFTPNQDGINDIWCVKGVNKAYYPYTVMRIFNRYGAFIAQTTQNEKGWNGTYNGKVFPTGEYWYTIQLIPANGTISPIHKKGHFSLLRR